MNMLYIWQNYLYNLGIHLVYGQLHAKDQVIMPMITTAVHWSYMTPTSDIWVTFCVFQETFSVALTYPSSLSVAKKLTLLPL